MAHPYFIYNISIVNEGEIAEGSVLIENGKIKKIIKGSTNRDEIDKGHESIDGKGKYLIPGIIDDHVHFREPGLTNKGDIYTESRAGVAGGVTSFMDMPNTLPQAVSIGKLNEKFRIASEKSLANYSFYLGATNDNLDEIKKADKSQVCGIKLFMGSSTGNMLVDNESSLRKLFNESEILIAAHCEDEQLIKSNFDAYFQKTGNSLDVSYHPLIRSEEACYQSSSLAVDLAYKYNTRLHLLHMTTGKEMSLLDNSPFSENKKITAEVCVNHLWFNEKDYFSKGNLIKVNPAIKTETDRLALLSALSDHTIDVIASDHAPHLLEEKMKDYANAPSGAPMIQHSLPLMLELYHRKMISLENIIEKMCHAPARIFHIEKRGFIREGFQADLVIVDLNDKNMIVRTGILYKCGWSPLEGIILHSKICMTFVNGNLVYNHGSFNENLKGQALTFKR